MSEIKGKFANLQKFKYPLLVLIIGIMLMLLPTGSKTSTDTQDKDAAFQQILSSTEGVGEVKVIVSESGVVVVCQGADNAKVRLDIIRAIGSYTGFSSDKITVLKFAD